MRARKIHLHQASKKVSLEDVDSIPEAMHFRKWRRKCGIYRGYLMKCAKRKCCQNNKRI